MGRMIVRNQVTTNGAFEAPSPEGWLELDADSGDDSLQQLILGDPILGRRTYKGMASVWPNLVEDSALGHYAPRINTMPKYVASRTLNGHLDWNANLIECDIIHAVSAWKDSTRQICSSPDAENSRTLRLGPT